VTVATWSSRGLWAVGLLFIVIGQYESWCIPEGERQNVVPSGHTMESRPSVPLENTRPDFQVLHVESSQLNGKESGKRVVRVLLRNRLERPVTILGATSGCHPAGCWEAVGFPHNVEPAAEVLIEFEANWTKSPEQPLPITVFTNVSLSEQLELDLLPDHATLRPTGTSASIR
jgi:hypothetical protein